MLRKILHSAIDKVFHWSNLTAASRHVARKKGRGGVDGMSVQAWQAEEHKHLGRLRHRLLNDTYRSKPVLRRYIDKPGSKTKRPLGVPAVGDRVCQQAVHRVLSPVFEAYFHEDSQPPGADRHHEESLSLLRRGKAEGEVERRTELVSTIGISSYGAYVPPTRLAFSTLSGHPAEEGGPEKAVAWNDEDSVTMGVTAAVNCLRGIERSTVDGVLFASTTYAFREKQAAGAAEVYAYGTAVVLEPENG